MADLSERLDLSRSTTHRYLTTLVALGYLEQDKRRLYRLGLRAHDLGLGLLVYSQLAQITRPVLESLSAATGWLACCAVLDEREILIVDQVRRHRHGQRCEQDGTRLAPGARRSASSTAAGAALLASQTNEQLLAIFGDAGASQRIAELAGVALAGYATHELDESSAIAVVVLDSGAAPVCALELICFGASSTGLIECLPKLQRAARRLGSSLPPSAAVQRLTSTSTGAEL